MRTLAIVAMVMLAWAAPGCGEDGGGDGAGGRGDGDGAPAVDPLAAEPCDGELDPAASASDLRVEVAHGRLARGEPVEWTVDVFNDGSEAVRLVFFSGQQADVTLSDASGEVYRWSAARSFTQAIQCATLGGGEGGRIVLGDDILEINPGEYRIEASLTARPDVEPYRGTVSVGS